MSPYFNNLKPSATKAKNSARKRRPRRELPENLTDLYIADTPTELDVIAGRGGGANHHEGNKRYWRRVLVERPGYKQLGKNNNTEKNQIAGAIYEYILGTGGRFLQLDSKTQKWFTIPKKISLDKIKQALRDKYVPHFAKEEKQSPLVGPVLAPTVFTQQKDPELFLDFWSTKPTTSATKSDFSTTLKSSSLDITSILGQSSLDKLSKLSTTDFAPTQLSLSNWMSMPSKGDFHLLNIVGHDLTSKNTEDDWSKFPTQNKNTTKSFEYSLRGHPWDSLMRGDLIATVDNMSEGVKNSSYVPETPKSLQALLQQQMEAAIPSSRRAFVAAV